MATLDTLQDAVNTLTSSTTTLLNEVSVNKSTLTESKDLAETAATSATTQAAAAASSASAASSSASSASASASAASASAASASAIVTGVATGMPSVRPSLNLDFVNSKTVDPRISFTRSTTATYYDGKTTAKAEENLLKNSSNIGNANGWSVGALTVTQNSAVAPDGTTTATKLTTSASLSDQWMWQAMSRYYGEATSSVYVKAATHNYVRITTYDSTGTFAVTTVDLTNGNILSTVTGGGMDGTETVTVTSAGNGWYRIAISQTFQTSGIGIHIQENSTDFSNSSYGVRAWTGTGAESIYVWGAQIEGHPSATAYTPTTTSPITNYIPVLQTAAINEPRLDHDPVTGEAKGLLIEEARTNEYSRSYEFNNATYANAFRTANNAVAPDGTQTASELVSTDVLGESYMHIPDFVFSGGETCTISCYVKANGDVTSASMGFGGSRSVATYDLASGTVTTTYSNGTDFSNESATIQAVGNGWYRCSFTVTAAGGTWYSRIYPTAYADRVVAGNNFDGMFIWGLQFESGSFPTSYIPTSGASVTRASDRADITNIDTYDWFNQKEGSFYHEGSFLGYVSSTYGRSGSMMVGISDTTGMSFNKQVILNAYLNDVSMTNNATITAIATTAGDVAPSGEGDLIKAAGTYSPNRVSVSANGSAVVQNTSTNFVGFPFQNMTFSRAYDGSVRQGHVKKISYYAKALPDSELQALTQS